MQRYFTGNKMSALLVALNCKMMCILIIIFQDFQTQVSPILSISSESCRLYRILLDVLELYLQQKQSIYNGYITCYFTFVQH